MQINLLDTIKSQISNDILKKAADFIGEEGSVTQKALDIVLPSLLGGMMNQMTEPNAAASLLSKFTEGGHDGSILDTFGNLLGGGSATQGLMDSGDSIVSSLFGNKSSSIVDWIAAFTGIKTGSASGLMSMVAPLVMGAIGKQVVGENMGLSGLTSLLGSQSGFIKKALPAGLASVLGLKMDAAPSVLASPKGLSQGENGFQRMDEKSFMNKILPWAIMLFAGFVGLMFLRTCKSTTPEPPAIVAVPDTPPVQAAAVDTVTTIKLPEGDLKVKTGSFLDQLNKEATDNSLDSTKALTFDNVNFATGSTVLTEGSIAQLLDLIKIMRAYPKVAIKIEGHTDNKGNAQSNKKLSLGRAESVMKFLQSNGVEATRMTVAGLGSDKPAGDNATEVGRAKNRRIEAYVIKK